MKKYLILLSLTIVSLSSNAAILSHHGYSHDTSTNIVTGEGLDWLQWDETVGLSINEALNSYGSSGWRLASNIEMAGLFNTFNFGRLFTSSENTNQLSYIPFSYGEDTDTHIFIDLFGDTEDAGSTYVTGDLSDPVMRASAMFGSDQDSDGLYNYALVRDDYRQTNGLREDARIYIERDVITADNNYNRTFGIALVRVTPVPLPAALWLFGSALIALGLVGYRPRN